MHASTPTERSAPHGAKYIGLDVHKESISIAVMNAAGKIVMECVIPAVRAAAYFRAAAGDGYGCSLFHSGRRDHYDLAASKYKEFIIVAGATHGGTPCKDCPGGPYTNSIRNMFDYMAKWINTRWSANY